MGKMYNSIMQGLIKAVDKILLTYPYKLLFPYFYNISIV